MATERSESTSHHRETRPGVRYYCLSCERWVILHVPCLKASCTRCGKRMVAAAAEVAPVRDGLGVEGASSGTNQNGCAAIGAGESEDN
jgi:hypothetical protein